MASPTVRYLVFDVESVADGQLLAQLRHPGQSITPEEAITQYRAELMEKYESDFIPYTYQIPIAIAAAKVGEDFSLLDLVALDEPLYRPHVMVENFWRGWEAYRRPTLVSFNGHYFDLPLLELAAFRYGISIPGWFTGAGRTFEQPRNRYNIQAHIDLCDLLTNFGATRFTGGLNLAANLLGKPGKMDIQGCMVQDLYQAGRLPEIQDYCRCDVLDTYFVFLRSRVLLGQLSLDEEQQLVLQTKQWLQSQADRVAAYRLYLDHWGDWPNPWQTAEPGP
ncbi:MAG TPA: 3'-5' exonuclease [Thermoguttaceae bacterium]|nr:3'-5' exonuclease [Thermoguttaceae bacterium]HPP53277.1 3'-5' exonuclease [Thermoguttaceae bacterium]